MELFSKERYDTMIALPIATKILAVFVCDAIYALMKTT